MRRWLNIAATNGGARKESLPDCGRGRLSNFRRTVQILPLIIATRGPAAELRDVRFAEYVRRTVGAALAEIAQRRRAFSL
jgi:hypothetical protein